MNPNNNDADSGASLSNVGLAACPCGNVPTELGITDANQGSKWAFVTGDCCGEWTIEFRTNYAALDSDECKGLAVEAWNTAPRAANEPAKGRAESASSD